MGLRFSRRVKILTGVTLDFSRRCVSTSIGVRGTHVTYGKDGTRAYVNTPDVIRFQATNLPDLEKSFRASVDDDLAFCAERGEAPEQPCSGKFMLRLSPEIHRKAFIAARHAQKNLNAWAVDVLEWATS